MSKPKNMSPEQEAAWRSRVNARSRQWKKENREKVNEWSRRAYKKNPEKYCLSTRRFYKKNGEKIRAARRHYYETNREECCLSARQYHEKNREKCLLRNKEWRKNNPEKVRKWKKMQSSKITDYYIKHMLTTGTDLQFKDIPENLVSLKRGHLKTQRKLKTINQ